MSENKPKLTKKEINEYLQKTRVNTFKMPKRQPFPRPFSVSQIALHNSQYENKPGKPILDSRTKARVDCDLSALVAKNSKKNTKYVKQVPSFYNLKYTPASKSSSKIYSDESINLSNTHPMDNTQQNDGTTTEIPSIPMKRNAPATIVRPSTDIGSGFNGFSTFSLNSLQQTGDNARNDKENGASDHNNTVGKQKLELAEKNEPKQTPPVYDKSFDFDFFDNIGVPFPYADQHLGRKNNSSVMCQSISQTNRYDNHKISSCFSSKQHEHQPSIAQHNSFRHHTDSAFSFDHSNQQSTDKRSHRTHKNHAQQSQYNGTLFDVTQTESSPPLSEDSFLKIFNKNKPQNEIGTAKKMLPNPKKRKTTATVVGKAAGTNFELNDSLAHSNTQKQKAYNDKASSVFDFATFDNANAKDTQKHSNTTPDCEFYVSLGVPPLSPSPTLKQKLKHTQRPPSFDNSLDRDCFIDFGVPSTHKEVKPRSIHSKEKEMVRKPIREKSSRFPPIFDNSLDRDYFGNVDLPFSSGHHKRKCDSNKYRFTDQVNYDANQFEPPTTLHEDNIDAFHHSAQQSSHRRHGNSRRNSRKEAQCNHDRFSSDNFGRRNRSFPMEAHAATEYQQISKTITTITIPNSSISITSIQITNKMAK